MKSIVIFGKGPSVLRCNKEIVDQYDDIAIINYPVLNNFFCNLIKNKEIKYHFANCGTFDERYNDEFNKKLKIKQIINTNYPPNKYYHYLQDKSLFKEDIIEYRKYFKDNFNLNSSTGILALKYILDSNLYNKILLVGFDNYKKGDPVYYYSPKFYNNKIKYLLGNTFTQDGLVKLTSGHNPNNTKKYLHYVIENNKNIKFYFITNMNLNKYDNLFII